MKIRQWLTKAAYSLQRFMYGRYGSDELSFLLILISIVFMILSNFKNLWFFYFVAIIPLGLAFWRSMSKNVAARSTERTRFLNLVAGPKAEIKLLSNRIRDRKTHRYYKCPTCKSALRVPKGKGKIAITCPKCGNRITKKT